MPLTSLSVNELYWCINISIIFDFEIAVTQTKKLLRDYFLLVPTVKGKQDIEKNLHPWDPQLLEEWQERLSVRKSSFILCVRTNIPLHMWTPHVSYQELTTKMEVTRKQLPLF